MSWFATLLFRLDTRQIKAVLYWVSPPLRDKILWTTVHTLNAWMSATLKVKFSARVWYSTQFPVGSWKAGSSQKVWFDGIVSKRKAGGGYNSAVLWINPRRNMESNEHRACRFTGSRVCVRACGWWVLLCSWEDGPVHTIYGGDCAGSGQPRFTCYIRRSV